ncbi:hypothetical protein D8Y22_05450 [Salinadaptatus halalkaliphilus]|uniref:Uncharacterized protein n=1 Tax=Salinadaptatus halalkaliphilus TaxID=2419781 RepID=A0A4S3TQ66_9EURY|nr:hypothetical protein [Salinadaptatus halalkaliphilus]THE65830.1 hypothetical protein D8Y22_05450 [Salinadaptatus halalkaliphilus]
MTQKTIQRSRRTDTETESTNANYYLLAPGTSLSSRTLEQIGPNATQTVYDCQLEALVHDLAFNRSRKFHVLRVDPETNEAAVGSGDGAIHPNPVEGVSTADETVFCKNKPWSRCGRLSSDALFEIDTECLSLEKQQGSQFTIASE